MSLPDFADWFCLAPGRKNFRIDPLEHNSVLFGDPKEDEEIDRRLQRSQLLSLPLRLVWWGQYGIGKTHRLRHTAHIVKSRSYKYDTHYVVCGDISEKTGFDRLHYQLINSLGREVMQGLVRDYILRHHSGEDVPSLKDLCGTSSDVADALDTFGTGKNEAIRAAWQFLCGAKSSSKEDARVAGVTKPVMDLTNDYVAALTALATIVEKQTGKQLLYLIDEVEKLMRITNATAEAAWNETLRAMLDIPNLNVVFTVGVEKLDQLPKLLTFQDIVRRIQKDNYIIMPALRQPDAITFVKQLCAAWVSAERRTSLEAAEQFATNITGYQSDLFPFANELVFQKFIENVTSDQRESKPSVIIDKLNNAAAEALIRGERLITDDLLTSMDYA